MNFDVGREKPPCVACGHRRIYHVWCERTYQGYMVKLGPEEWVPCSICGCDDYIPDVGDVHVWREATR